VLEQGAQPFMLNSLAMVLPRAQAGKQQFSWGKNLDNEFSMKGCAPCSNTIENKHCSVVILSPTCKKLVGKNIIKKGDIVTPLFSPEVCMVGGSKGSPSTPKPQPVPVPSCAIDKGGKFAGCAACVDPRQYPAVDGRICNGQLVKFKLVVGVTDVIRSDNLPDPSPPPTNPPLPPPTTSTPSKQKTGGDGRPSTGGPSSLPKTAKMCSHDPTKLNGNGQGCATCQGRVKTPPTADLAGNDYWACSECRQRSLQRQLQAEF